MSEGSAKDERRKVGAAEYVKPMRFTIQNSKFKIQN